MKKCQEIQTDLSAYIDNELPMATRTIVEKHIQGCGVCREQLAELKQLTAGIVALPRLQPAPGLLSEVRRRITQGSKCRPSWQDYIFRPLWLKVPLEAVAVVVIVLFVMRVERSANERKPGHKALMPAEEPASTPIVLGAKPRSIEKLAPNRLVGSAAPSLADTVSGDIVVVHAKDFDDARNRVQQLASTMNGRIMPPPLGKTPAHMLFVELPSGNAEAFKSRLQSTRPLSAAPQPSPANGPNSVVDEVGHSERTSARVVVRVQVLLPAD